MRFGLSVYNMGELANARVMADLAQAAERAGWEALLVWDHLAFTWGPPSGDVWTLITASAMATDRLLVGTDVAVIARERPLPLANRVATIDRLSSGRLVLGVGIGGAADEYRVAGEPQDLRERAALTDEMLSIVRPLLAGETVTHHGAAGTVEGVTMAPLPVQRPVPVWIGGQSAGARRRAARHDGWIPYAVDQQGNDEMTPDELRAAVEEIRALRAAAGIAPETPFQVGVHGETSGREPGDRAKAAAWADAGATWWLEGIHGFRGSTAELFARVEAGPPGD